MPAGGLRWPLFVAATVVVLIIVLAEFGLSFALGGHTPATSQLADPALGITPDLVTGIHLEPKGSTGSGIRYLALIDGLLLYTLALLGSSLMVSQRVYGRVQGIVTLIVAIIWLLICLVCAILAFVKLLLMIGLFVAVPFGTIAYLALWGFFPTGAAAAVLGLLLLLKLVFVGLLFLAQPRFLKVKGLMILTGLSIALQLVLGLIQGFLPSVVVSIGDEFWAIVIAVVALIWALIMLIMAIPAIVNALRVTATTAVS